MPLSIMWFRQDLRLSDNPALNAAARKSPIIPIYILDTVNSGEQIMGRASRWWLHHSLVSLDRSIGGCLSVFRGDPLKILKQLIQKHKVSAIFWNRCYEPWRVKSDKIIKRELQAVGLEIFTFNGSLLWEPWKIKKDDGTPYGVFTPFFKRCLRLPKPRQPICLDPLAKFLDPKAKKGKIISLDLLPQKSWGQKLEAIWLIGEDKSKLQLKNFLRNGLNGYKEGRNFPTKENVSRISPYLHFGEASPNQVWYSVLSREQNSDVDHFCRQLGWREFSYYLLYHNPKILQNNLQPKFDGFPWKDPGEDLERWKCGQTGYPIVDAGMRELWQTGYMHNRVRMVVGSFLVKNLRIHWRHGERWFWDCLVDADLANNVVGWQWVAGTGADAAPYFRIFNPVLQGERFDPAGEYTLKFLPELRHVPKKHLFSPWENGIGNKNLKYPKPIVDLQTSRKEALLAFGSLTE